MIRTRILTLLLFGGLLFGNVAYAASAEPPDLGQADQAYRSGDYASAAQSYESIIGSGWSSGELLYNLGNCYYKQGLYGLAILNYERAKRFLGSDEDLEINLKLANLMTPDRITPLPRLFLIRFVQWICQWFPLRGWAILLLLVEWVLFGCLLGLHFLNKPGHRRLLSGLFFVAVVVFLLAGTVYAGLSLSQKGKVEGVLIADQTEVRSAPETGSTELFAVHAGVKFKILRQVPGWAEINLADGKRGWISQSTYQTI